MTPVKKFFLPKPTRISYLDKNNLQSECKTYTDSPTTANLLLGVVPKIAATRIANLLKLNYF